MGTAFSEKEKEQIVFKLKTAAQECLGKYGVRKTTVDQLVQMAGISKGAFYIFYPSKEILLYKVVEEFQKSIIEEVFCRLNKPDNLSVKEFSELIFELYEKARSSFIVNIIQNQEFEYLIRKIPESYIVDHHSFDDILVKKILSHIKIKNDFDVSLVSASLRAIFMSMLHVKEIGQKDFDIVLKILINGLAQQLIEE